MQGHTKKPHIDEVSITFTGPGTMMERAFEVMCSLGFKPEEQGIRNKEAENSLPWRESEYFKDVHVGSYLSGARFREGMTQAELSQHTGIPRRHISEMENGKRPIGKVNARKLAEALNIDSRLLLTI